MASTLTLAAAAQALRRLDRGSGQRTGERLDQLQALLDAMESDQLDLNLGQVVDALFPGHPQGLARFRDFRSDLRGIARDEGIDLTCHVDGQKHAPPSERRCWFTGTSDEVQRIEQLSHDATAPVPGAVAIEDVLARRAVYVCIDGPRDGTGDALTSRLKQALLLDREFYVEVSDTKPLAGEAADEIRVARLESADIVVCLLSVGYLAGHARAEMGIDRVVVPVALEPLGAAIDLHGFEAVFTLNGISYSACRKKQEFVNVLHEQIIARLQPSSERNLRAGPQWELLVGEVGDHVVEARALETSLGRKPATEVGLDARVEVQSYLRRWAIGTQEKPYLIIFGEYGMGKTTACQVFTRSLLERRREGDDTARLPIYLDLRNLGDVKHREPTLTIILESLLQRIWQSGATGSARVAEIIDHVQRKGAIIIFDGLDEVLVHLTEMQGQALLRELWKILPPSIIENPTTRPGAGRVLFTCRTHFFRTLSDQHTYFRGEEREVVGLESYAALHLLPFTFDQVRVYIERRELDGGDEGTDRAMRLIRSVHNLSELVKRPFNLRLVADQLSALERRIATGGRVNTAVLYEELVATWLDRDQGKHQLQPRHKIRLMEELAATMWREGRRAMCVDRLEDWLYGRLDTDDEIGRWFRLSGANLNVLAEDLRTATFVVRPGVDEFEFAHTSLLEYFLARHLARTLEEGDTEAWALPMPGDETLNFLGEIIAARDTEACLEGLRTLRTPYRQQASELAFGYCVHALSRDAPSLPLAGFSLDGALLRHIDISGSRSGPLRHLTDCSMVGADLRQARLHGVRIERCDLSSALLNRAEAHDCAIEDVAFDCADLTGFVARGCSLENVRLQDAQAHRTQWLDCRSDRVAWPMTDDSHLFAGTPANEGLVARPERDDASLVSFVGHSGGIRGVAWSPDGVRLASAGADSMVRVWDCATGEELLHFAGHGGGTFGVAWSPDGTHLASAGEDGTVRVWDCVNGRELRCFAGHRGWVRSVAWSPDGARLASCGNDNTVRVWAYSSGEELCCLVGHRDWVCDVAWSPDGTRLASAGNDGMVRVWDCTRGEEILNLAGHGYAVRSVAWSPDGTRLASGGVHEADRVWDCATGEEIRRLAVREGGGSLSMAWSPDGRCLASAGMEGRVRLWDCLTGEELTRLAGHSGWALCVVWSPDGGCVASAGTDGTVRVWDGATGDEMLRLGGHINWALSVAWSPDAEQIATAGEDGMVRVWDRVTGDELLHMAGHRGRALSVAWSPDGTRLGSTGDDGALRIWDRTSGSELLCLTGRGECVCDVAWSPDGTRLASVGDDGAVRVWDDATGEEMLRTAGHGGWALGVAWSPDGERLASVGDDGVVRVWDCSTGEQRFCLMGHVGRALSVAWSPDGTWLASAGQDGTVRVWACAPQAALLSLDGHIGPVRRVAWATVGMSLASVGDDGTVRVWDCATGEESRRLASHGGGAFSVAWSPDAGHLASVGDDGAVRVQNPASTPAELVIHVFDQTERAVEREGHLASCSSEAWRWLGWLAPSPTTGQLTRYPAETFGRLPEPDRL